MASRIALYEAGASGDLHGGGPRHEAHPGRAGVPGGLPARSRARARTESGELLTENAAVLQFLAARFPEAGLSPRDALGQARLQQWLCFIGTELHKTVFGPLLDRSAPEGARAYALEKAPSRFELLDRHLSGREFLLDAFSVADAYLFTVLGWSVVTPIELGKWSALAAYHERLAQRPSVARARAEEVSSTPRNERGTGPRDRYSAGSSRRLSLGPNSLEARGAGKSAVMRCTSSWQLARDSAESGTPLPRATSSWRASSVKRSTLL